MAPRCHRGHGVNTTAFIKLAFIQMTEMSCSLLTLNNYVLFAETSERKQNNKHKGEFHPNIMRC